jgi:predicted exporter
VLAGQLQGVATWHSVLLCMTLAPLGLLSHSVTKALARRS